MIKLLGAAMVLLGSAAAGLSAAGHLRRRSACLRALAAALEYMEREIKFRLTALPELFAALEGDAQADVSAFFSVCLRELNRRDGPGIAGAWAAALQSGALPLKDDETAAVRVLGAALGQYDAPSQRHALQAGCGEVRTFLRRAEDEQARMGRVYGVLSVSAGAFVVLLMI